MTEVSIAEAKAKLAALVSRAEAGEQIVVTRNGRPVACLGPLLTRDRILTAYSEHATILRFPDA